MTPALTTSDLANLVISVGVMSAAADDAERIERLRQFEALRSAITAAQAAVAVEFDRSQRAAQAAEGVPRERLGRGVGAQVGFARRVSPWQAQRWLGWAKILISELPATYAELAAGRTTEWRTMIMARETACLSREQRSRVDTELAPQLQGWGDRRIDAEARKAAYRLDPAAAVARARHAVSERRVSLRPAPDTMGWFGALLPLAQSVATYAALKKAADLTVAAGDERSRGQIMADTLVERVTGQATADAVLVEIVLIMNDETLFDQGVAAGAKADFDGADETEFDCRSAADEASEAQPTGKPEPDGVDSGSDARPDGRTEGHAGANAGAGADEPAWLQDYGPVPAGWARELAYGRDDKAPAAPRWIRRMYTERGRPVELESSRRLFTVAQQRFLRLRDQTCRTPWCDAPIRHADHVQPHADGGPTHTDNGQGLCEACNHAKQAPGWTATTDIDGVVTTRTPTGASYQSHPPAMSESRKMTQSPLIRKPPTTAPPPKSLMELRFAKLIAEHEAAA